MAARVKFKLDHAGVAEILRTEFGELIDGKAEEIANIVRESGKPVDVERYITDRQAAAVIVTDFGAMADEARNGTLTRAAAQAGLEVRARHG